MAEFYHIDEGSVTNSISDLSISSCIIMPDKFPTSIDVIEKMAKPKDEFHEIIHPLTGKTLSIPSQQKLCEFGEHGKKLSFLTTDIRPTKRSIDLLVELLQSMVVKGGDGFYYDSNLGRAQRQLDKAVEKFFDKLFKLPEMESDALLHTQVPTENKGVTVGSLFGLSAGIGSNKTGYRDGKCTHVTGKQIALVAYQFGASLNQLPSDARSYVDNLKSNIPRKEPLDSDAYLVSNESETLANLF